MCLIIYSTRDRGWLSQFLLFLYFIQTIFNSFKNFKNLFSKTFPCLPIHYKKKSNINYTKGKYFFGIKKKKKKL